MRIKRLLGFIAAIMLALISSPATGMQVNITAGEYNISFHINDSIANTQTASFDFDTSYSGGYEDNTEITTVVLEKDFIDSGALIGSGAVQIINHEIITAISDRESILKELQEYMESRGWTDIKPIRRQIAGKDAAVVMATDKDGELKDITKFWFKIDKRRELIGTLYLVGSNATEVLDSFKLIQISPENTTQKLYELREKAIGLQALVTPAYDKELRGLISDNEYSNVFNNAKWAVDEYNRYLGEHFAESKETMVFQGPKTKRNENGDLVVDLT